MYFTKFQEEIINEVIENKIFDFYSFLNTMTECKYRNYIWSEYKCNLFDDYKNDENYINQERSYLFEINEDQISKLSEMIFQFIFIYEFLKRNDLIYTIKIKQRSLCPIFVFKNSCEIESQLRGELYKLNKINIDIHQIEFYASNSLKEFKNDGFLTKEELIFNAEKDHWKKSLFWTKITSGIAIVGVIATTLIQIFMNKGERDVMIKNENAFQDTSKVIILKNILQNKDSLENKNDTLKIKEFNQYKKK